MPNDMPNSFTLTIGGVEALVSDKVQDVSESDTVQVVGIEECVAPKGGRRVIIKTSDGVYLLGCFLSPKLFEMLDSEMLSLYSVISIHHVSSMSHTEDITLIILDASVVLTLDGVLGSPITYSKLTHLHSATDEIPLSHPSEQQVTCDHCNGVPCDWYMYGREIIELVTGMYNDTIDAKDNKRNNQMRFFVIKLSLP
jgi:hypothetical protein